MKIHIAFDRATGLIQRSTNFPIEPRDEYQGIVEIEVKPGAEGVDPGTQKINPKTGRLVKLNKTERRAPSAFLSVDIQSVVSRELHATDQFMIPDRPMADDKRAAWATYRQALRGLSKLPTPAKQIAAWPQRPDGQDPIVHLRARITG